MGSHGFESFVRQTRTAEAALTPMKARSAIIQQLCTELIAHRQRPDQQNYPDQQNIVLRNSADRIKRPKESARQGSVLTMANKNLAAQG